MAGDEKYFEDNKPGEDRAIFFSFDPPQGLWDLSSLTRGRIWLPCSGSAES